MLKRKATAKRWPTNLGPSLCDEAAQRYRSSIWLAYVPKSCAAGVWTAILSLRIIANIQN
ncbi:hypothetical protein D9754_02760 [Planomicrobium sp. Y74]|nr:hypothetical protein D9754_02760 [Planomicrobium sp. Y74]